MKKKIFSLISIFIICFSLTFSIFDKVSFAADSVTYVCETTKSGKHFSFEGQPGFTPFIVNSYIAGDTAIPEPDRYRTYFVVSNGYDIIKNASGWTPSNKSFNGMRCQAYGLWGQDMFSVAPSVPLIQNKFNTYKEQEAYIASLIQDPTLIPINVTTHDSSLGSLQLQDSTSWRFLRYEPLTGNTSAKKDGYAYKVKLRTIFQDTTTTGQKYDKIQIMVRLKNIRSQWSAIITHPWKDKLQEGEYFSYYLSDLKSPTTVDLQMLDYTTYEETGKLNKVLYPIFQPAFDKLGLSKPAFSNDYWFICDYTICYRPVTVDGKFGDWFYITPDKSLLGDNMVGGGQGISAVTGTAQSDDNPNSLAFNPLPEDSTFSQTASGNGETLGDAINNSNNSLIGGSISGGGSLTNNITDLFSFFTNLPYIISAIFGWLPPWVLDLFSIGFALFVPIFIYKFVRG